MSYAFQNKDIDQNDGTGSTTGSLSYSASSCVSDDSSVPEDSQYLSSFLEREQQLHNEDKRRAQRCRSLRESPQRGNTTGSASDSLDDDAAYEKFRRIRTENVPGQTSDSKRHDGGTHCPQEHKSSSRSSRTKMGSSPATVATSDASLRSDSKGSSRQHRRILSDPKNEVWYERLLCGMNSNC